MPKGVRRMLSVTWIAGIVAVFLLPAEIVHASNWYGATGGTGWCAGNIQDNSTMTYFRTTGVSPSMRTAITNSLVSDFVPTDLVVSPELSAADANTDVVYTEGNFAGLQATCGSTDLYWHGSSTYPPGASVVIGWTNCLSLSGSRCQRFDVYIDSSWESSATSAGRAHLACHESGHAVGLTHNVVSSCMKEFTSTALSSHDSGEINAHY